MARKIVKVNGCRWLIAELNAFYLDLVVCFANFGGFGCLSDRNRIVKFVNAVFLIRFVSLSHYNLLDGARPDANKASGSALL